MPTPTSSPTHRRRRALAGAIGLMIGATAPLVVGSSVAGASTSVLLFSSTTPGTSTVTVPAGVTSVQITAVGGNGGDGEGSVGGLGAVVTATAAVAPGAI